MGQEKENRIKDYQKPRVVALYTVMKEKEPINYNKKQIVEKTHTYIEKIGGDKLGITAYSTPTLDDDLGDMEKAGLIKKKGERESNGSHIMKINPENQSIIESWDEYKHINDKLSNFLSPPKEVGRTIADKKISKMEKIDEDNIERLINNIVASVRITLDEENKEIEDREYLEDYVRERLNKKIEEQKEIPY